MELSGIIALLVAIIGSRMISESGFRKLDSEAKLRLIDGFSNNRAYSMIPILLLVGLYWLLASYAIVDSRSLALGFFGVLIVYVVVRLLMIQRKMVELEMPADYRQKLAVAQAVSMMGLAWFLFSMCVTMLGGDLVW